jgi:hypothetical protein
MLSVVATWSVRNGISVNLPKSGVILPLTSSPLTLSLWDKPLPVVREYTYLGMPFTASGIDFKTHLSSLRSSTLKLFFASSKNSRSWTPFLRLAMFKIFYRSKYEYAFPLLLASGVTLGPSRNSKTCYWNGLTMDMLAPILIMLWLVSLQLPIDFRNSLCGSNTSPKYARWKPATLSSPPLPVVAHSFSFFTTTTLVLFLSPFPYVPTIPGRKAEGPTMDLLDLYLFYFRRWISFFQKDPLFYPNLFCHRLAIELWSTSASGLRSAKLRSFVLLWRKNRLIASL